MSVKQAWRMQGAEGAEGAAGAEVLLLLLPGLRECVGRCRSQSDETRLPQRWRFLRLGFEPSRRPEHGRRASTAGPVATVAASDAPLIPALLGSEARGGAGEGCGGRGAMTRRRHAWRVSIWPRLRTVTPTVRPGQLPSSRARHEAAASIHLVRAMDEATMVETSLVLRVVRFIHACPGLKQKVVSVIRHVYSPGTASTLRLSSEILLPADGVAG